jgi:hypothetical protein
LGEPFGAPFCLEVMRRDRLRLCLFRGVRDGCGVAVFRPMEGMMRMGLLTDLLGLDTGLPAGTGGFGFSSVLSPGSTDPAFLDAVRILETLGLNSNPEDPRHYYDYKSALSGGAKLAIDPASQELHWPSEYKMFGHPTYANKYNPAALPGAGPVTDQNDDMADFLEKLLQMYRVTDHDAAATGLGLEEDGALFGLL